MEKELTKQVEPEVIGKKGKVVNCIRLYVRAAANKKAEAVTVISKDAIVQLNANTPAGGWYSVTVVVDKIAVKGYCVAKYIQAI